MMRTLIALVIAIAAISVNHTSHTPASFTRHFANGRPSSERNVMHSSFVGWEWRCGDETCFAGIDDGDLVTGP